MYNPFYFLNYTFVQPSVKSAFSLFLFLIFGFMECRFMPSSMNDSSDYESQHKTDLYPYPNIDGLFLDSAAIRMEESYFIPLTNPIWHEGQYATYMRPEDIVIGILLDTQAYAFPWWVLKNHHIANITIDDQPLLITLCEMCSEAACFIPMKDTIRLNFFQQGIYKGTWFMRDAESNSFWLPFSGECFSGVHKGSRLKYLESFQVEWRDWLQEQPNTMVLYDIEDQRNGHGAEEFPGYSRIAKSFEKTFKQPIKDISNPFDLVIGVDLGVVFKAYTLSTLDQLDSLVYQDVVFDSIHVVLFHKPYTHFAGAYKPWVNQKLIHFTSRLGQIEDIETQSIWNVTGHCIQGKLKGQKLSSYFFGVKEKYSWFNYHPKSLIL